MESFKNKQIHSVYESDIKLKLIHQKLLKKKHCVEIQTLEILLKWIFWIRHFINSEVEAMPLHIK